MIAAAEEKLRLLNITEEQIAEIKMSGKPSPYVLLKANTNGTVIHLAVAQGNYVQQGQSLIPVADLNRVWAVFEAYERDLPFLHVGDELEFTGDAFAGETFRSRITYIDPILNGTSRTAGVRLELTNTDNRFKPEMLIVGNAHVNMKQYAKDVIVPASAVMWTGKRSVVYVRDKEEEMPTFVQRQVTLGPTLAGSYVITDGLKEGEVIAVNGTFVIDASAQLQGRKSMMSLDPEAQTRTVSFFVDGACGMCKTRIEKVANEDPGVSSAQWDKQTKQLTLTLDDRKTNEKKIQKALAAVGHDTPNFKASDDVYDKLPKCCKYRK